MFYAGHEASTLLGGYVFFPTPAQLFVASISCVPKCWMNIARRDNFGETFGNAPTESSTVNHPRKKMRTKGAPRFHRLTSAALASHPNSEIVRDLRQTIGPFERLQDSRCRRNSAKRLPAPPIADQPQTFLPKNSYNSGLRRGKHPQFYLEGGGGGGRGSTRD